MVVENVMYFALGLLAAGLVALLIMPAIWKRAVRLTKKRIEAATPMSMAEFRADKDQLRAEYALATRRLEMTVETLRARLAEQLREINSKKGDFAAAKSERDNQLTIIRELEEREADLRRRVLEVEKENADIALKLRKRDREYEDKVAELETARTAAGLAGAGVASSGAPEVERLLSVIAAERERVGFLEAQNAELIVRLEGKGGTAVLDAETAGALAAAEARFADAESRISTLLAETGEGPRDSFGPNGHSLAEELTIRSEMNELRDMVLGVESTLMADMDTDRLDPARLRERLNDIAATVGRLANAEKNGAEAPADDSESLFDRVQRFAVDDQRPAEAFPLRTALEAKQAAATSAPARVVGNAERVAAAREIRSRG